MEGKNKYEWPIEGHQPRILGLDILRISLAFLIYMFHSIGHFGCSYSILTDFVSVGAIAMTGFFMLSGYTLRLVYGDTNLTNKSNLLRFYLKRILSVLPLYYIVALSYILFLGNESFVENLLLLPIEALGLQSTFSSLFDVSHNDGTWFISCLVLSYIIYPFIQMICKQSSIRLKVIILMALIFIDIYAVIVSHEFNTARTYDNPFYRILESACGVIIADINLGYNFQILKVLRSRLVLISSAFILIIGVSIMHHYLTFGDFMLYNCIVLPCTALMLLSLGKLEMPLLARRKSIRYLSQISYAFFLVQYFCWPICTRFIEMMKYDSNWFRIFISFTFCLISSIILYEVIQRPITKFVKIKVLG